MKKAISLLLFAVIIISALPRLALPAAAVTSGYGWSFDEGTGTLTFSGVNSTSDYTGENLAPWYEYRDRIKKLVLPEGFFQIGDLAFYGCTALTEVAIPSSVKIIGAGAFYECSRLEKVTLPGAIQTIKESAFYGCTSLSKVYMDDAIAWCSVMLLDSASNPMYYGADLYIGGSPATDLDLTGVSGMIDFCTFYGCTSLRSVVIPSAVYSVGQYAFCGCTALESVTVPSSVTSIGEGAFYGCESISAVNITGAASWCSIAFGDGASNPLLYGAALYIGGAPVTELVLTGVKSVPAYAFCGCSSLTSVALPSSVTSIGDYAFNMCSSLTSVSVTSNLTSIGIYAFYGCPVEYNVYGGGCYIGTSTNPYYALICPDGDGVAECTVHKETRCIAGAAFYGCVSLETLSMRSVVTIGAYAFCGCTSLRSASLGCSFLEAYAFAGCTSMESVLLGSVLSVGEGAFHGCSSLTSLRINEGLQKMGDLVFEDCAALTSVTLPDSLTSFGGAVFRNCTSLTEAVIGYGLKSTGDETFSGCTSLASVTFGPNVETVGYKAFMDCSSLVSVTVGSKVETIDSYAFYNCSSLEEIDLPDRVSIIGYCAFFGCSKLESFEFPAGTEEIYNYAFADCTSLREITVPDGVIYLGEAAFKGCTSLESAVIGNGVGTLNQSLFYGCSSLADVTIPNALTGIGAYAFCDCSSLSDVYYVGTEEEFGLIEIYRDGNEPFFAATVHCDPDLRPNVITGVCGESVSWELNVKTGALTVYGTGAMDNFFTGMTINGVRQTTSPFKNYRETIKSVVIKDGVTTVGGDAFSGCTAIKSVTAEGKTLLLISEYAFYGCTSLEEITLSEGVRAIGEYAFYGCSSLWRIGTPESLERVAEHALDGSAIEEFTVGPNMTYLSGSMFRNCASLRRIDITDVAVWCNLGRGVYSAAELLFDGEITLNGEPIKDLVIPEGVTRVPAAAFYGCTSLETVSLPDSLTIISSYSFGNCTSLKSVHIPENVYGLAGAFIGCASLESVTVDEDNRLLAEGEGCVIGKISHQLVLGSGDCVIPDDGSVTSIAYGAFGGQTALESIVIPDHITNVYGLAFYGCSSLTELYMSSDVTSIAASAFGECAALSDVYYSGTEEEWNAIAIGSDNDALLNATVHFNCALPSLTPGDVNGDGGRDMKDVLLLRRALAGLEELTPAEERCADVNSDGSLDIKDVLKLRRLLAGLE